MLLLSELRNISESIFSGNSFDERGREMLGFLFLSYQMFDEFSPLLRLYFCLTGLGYAIICICRDS